MPQPGNRGSERKEAPGTATAAPGASQVGADAAMRARDVARPRARDMARAERTVVTRRQTGGSSSAS
jgi:hypothetical protein